MNPINWRDLTKQHGSPLLVLDCDVLRAQAQALSAALPNVRLHYAVKAFTHPDVLTTLAALGLGFDVASQAELEMVRAAWVGPREIIHTHPIKRRRDIARALREGCTSFVVDNPVELEKFVEFRSRVGLLLRLRFEDPGARVALSNKFGCHLDEVGALLQRADELGIHVKGFSFHVGSQARDGTAISQAIRACLPWFEARAELGRPMRVLDIGGGFPSRAGAGGELPVDIHDWCAPIREAMVGLPDWIKLIAEPGRYLVAPAVTGVCEVIGMAVRDGQPWYYVDDGVYGSFSGQIFDHAIYPLRPAEDDGSRRRIPSVVAGPTCDGLDVIARDIALPELSVGDLLLADGMGAYTAASATYFNGIAPARIVSVGAVQIPAGKVVPLIR